MSARRIHFHSVIGWTPNSAATCSTVTPGSRFLATRHDVLAELLRIRLGHSDTLPTCPTGQASSDVTRSRIEPTGCLGEQEVVTLKGWRLLRKLCRSTNRITDLVKAVLVLHHASA